MAARPTTTGGTAMKQLIAATALALVAGCAGLTDSSGAAAGTTASNETLPLYLQNPANCAEGGYACRRW
jgi:hypothetical protein